MSTARWLSRIVTVLFMFSIVNGWQHGHYPVQFMVLVLAGVSVAWVNGYREASS